MHLYCYSVSMSVIQTSPLDDVGGSNLNVMQAGDSTSSIVLLKRKKKSCPNNMIKASIMFSFAYSYCMYL